MNLSPMTILLIIWAVVSLLVLIDFKPSNIREALLTPVIALIMPFWLIYIILKYLFRFLFPLQAQDPNTDHPEDFKAKRKINHKAIIIISVIIATVVYLSN